MVALKVEGTVGEAGLQHRDGLVQPLNADAGPVHSDAALLVVGGQPPRAHSHFEPSARHAVQRGQLLGQHGRVAEVVGQHHGRDLHLRGDRCHHRQPHQRPALLAEVVGQGNAAVAEFLGPFGLRPQPVGIGDHSQLSGEPERPSHEVRLSGGGGSLPRLF